MKPHAAIITGMLALSGEMIVGKGETIVGRGETKIIDVETNQVALFETVIMDPWSAPDRHATWISGTNQVDLAFPTESPAKPLLLAGPGKLEITFPCVLTYRRMAMTNATTVMVLKNVAPVRIAVREDQRVSIQNAKNWGSLMVPGAMALLLPGEEFTDLIGQTRAISVSFSSVPKAFDGPWDILVWNHNNDMVLTYVIQEKGKSIRLEKSDDGASWRNELEIKPGNEARAFYRLTTGNDL